MLSILLLLAAAPQSAEAPAQTLRPATVQEMIDAGVLPPMPAAPANAARMPVLGDGGFGCRSEVRQASDPTAGNGLMWREGGEAVGLYRLLDRRVNGCPDPIVVNYRVPGSNALGREAGRDPGPQPSLTPAD